MNTKKQTILSQYHACSCVHMTSHMKVQATEFALSRYLKKMNLLQDLRHSICSLYESNSDVNLILNHIKHADVEAYINVFSA